MAADPCDAAAVVDLARSNGIDLVVVGPEAPLVAGVGDALRDAGFAVFGPNAAAAQLEGSKGFTKDLCRANGIPTADYVRVERVADALAALDRFAIPVVIKADGLAAGKGVTVAMSRGEAEAAIEAAGDGPLVIEEFLEGEEASLFALVDGETAVPLASAQDHKRVGEGDTGPNTGGMGAYSTDTLTTPAMREWLTKNVAQKVVDGMASDGTPFKGILFCGIMMAPRGPMVLEFNTRFGDPETQAILLRMETDVLDLLNASIDGTADSLHIKMHPGASVCVIAASGGYPGKYASGKPIGGLPSGPSDNVVVFHSGTAIKDGQLVTSGGRVLAITAMAPELRVALNLAYAQLAKISFEGMQFRRDIGHRALQQELCG